MSSTVTKRAATTGLYDCSYNPSGEDAEDVFTLEETVTISAQSYLNAWSLVAVINSTGINTEVNNALTSYGAATGADVDATETSLINYITGVNNTVLALNDFDPAVDVVAHVTLVDTTTDLTNGSGGGGGSATLANQNLILANIAAIDSDVQGLGTITTNTNTVVNTLNDFDPAVDVVAHVTLVDTTTNLTNGGSGGDDAATIYSYFTAGSNEDAFKADVSALALEATVDSVGTAVASVNSLVQLTPASTYSFFTSGSNEDAFKADVSALATSASLQSVATVVIDTNTDVNALNDITATDIWNYTDINGILPKSAQLQANYLFNINIETVTDKIDQMLVLNGEGTEYQYTVDALENGPTDGGSCPTAQEIVDTWGNQSQGSYTTSGTLGFYLDAQVSSAGGGGTGLYQATVRVQDNSSNALQGARVNIDGTTLTLTTDSSGEVTFNLDSGVYLLEVSPPAGYDTPTGQVLTVSTSDPTTTAFTLSSTSPPTGCDIPWIG